ncbi:MAG: bifunctional pyr operon transcriptional regulator/uracil phosphoribosyltransferase PyrR [Candidatus Omnitrophica bacterium]|nr:bifunctional pyr operon transcriptional regulator/uracil phosphoribosyltransferase PyrR [Candidatus Omnitrophota bacterium]
MMTTPSKQVLDSEGMEKALARIAHEIVERNQQIESVILVGIRTRGVYLSQRIQKCIQKIKNRELPLGILDITLYRDDLSEIGARASVRETKLPGDIKDKIVVLVDDVLFTGRTIRAALDAIHDFGRPKAIQLAVLIDRGHRELPIKADYVGKNIPTSLDEQVVVQMKEADPQDEVLVMKKSGIS